jgi:hypothetical protein
MSEELLRFEGAKDCLQEVITRLKNMQITMPDGTESPMGAHVKTSSRGVRATVTAYIQPPHAAAFRGKPPLYTTFPWGRGITEKELCARLRRLAERISARYATAQRVLDKRRAEQEAQQKTAEHRAAIWTRLVLKHLGGDPEERLPEEKKLQEVPMAVLTRAGTNLYAQLGIHIPLHTNMEKRAATVTALLAAVDKIIQCDPALKGVTTYTFR